MIQNRISLCIWHTLRIFHFMIFLLIYFVNFYFIYLVAKTGFLNQLTGQPLFFISLTIPKEIWSFSEEDCFFKQIQAPTRFVHTKNCERNFDKLNAMEITEITLIFWGFSRVFRNVEIFNVLNVMFFRSVFKSCHGNFML